MHTYHQIKAIQSHRFGTGAEPFRHDREPRRQTRPLSGLLQVLAGHLARLGVRDTKGKTRPASPAY